MVSKTRVDLVADNNVTSENVEIKAYWYLPHMLLLKFKTPYAKQCVHLTLFRSVLGARKFSQLLVGLTQFNSALNPQDDAHVHKQ